MRKRILLVTLLVSVVGILLLSVLFSDMFYRQSVQKVEGQLKSYMNIYAAEHGGDPLTAELALSLSEEFGGARVTFLTSDGTPVADSQTDASQMENHAAREEVLAALQTGEGYAVRESASVGRNWVYFCRLFGDAEAGFLVRLAIQADSGLAIFADALPTVVWFLFLDILICLFVAWIATAFILRPVEKLTQAAARSAGREVHSDYPELQPIAKMINDMNADLSDKVAKMKEDRRLEKLILNSMEHGIVIFRDPADIILINKTAMRLLDYETNEPIPCFTQDREIAQILASGESASVLRKIEGRDYSLRFTFNDRSRVLLITDMTETMAAARSKNELIANVTHEMNTPLTSIRGFAELIEAGGVPPEKLGSVAHTIIRQSDRLAHLIRSIINFSAIDSDELPDYEVDLSELVREAAAAFEPKIAQKNIRFALEADEGVKVLSRRERLLEIVNNLISNGIRYNKEGGSLLVRLQGGPEPMLCVRDTGVGISPENQGRIFDRFYTVDRSHNGVGGGFGLGLAIVKKLCRRAGWELSVESELGQGTAFVIRFCAKKAETPAKDGT